MKVNQINRWARNAVIAILCIVCLAMGSSCQLIRPKNPEQYTGYVCYDAHLTCLKKGRELGRTEYAYENDTGTYSVDIRFWKIPKESETQFVYAYAAHSIFFDRGSYIVMQNPDNYVDVLGTWHVEKLVFYCLDLQNVENREPKKREIVSTSDPTCISELVSFALAEPDPAKAEGTITSDIGKREVDDRYSFFYIRAYFSESKNIVWDAEVTSYLSDEESHQRSIYLRLGRKPGNDLYKNMEEYSIGKYCNLNSWVSDAIDEVAAK